MTDKLGLHREPSTRVPNTYSHTGVSDCIRVVVLLKKNDTVSVRGLTLAGICANISHAIQSVFVTQDIARSVGTDTSLDD